MYGPFWHNQVEMQQNVLLERNCPAYNCLGEFFRSGGPQYFSTDDIIHENKRWKSIFDPLFDFFLQL